MKLQEVELDIEKSDDFEENEFSFRASAMSFRILSSGLYAFKEKAILRELGTNAYDAHVESGNKETPFLVHLPNHLEPWLTIRDYGTGISPADMKAVYTQYFNSTKRDSDEQTGCLGLGSKSPFCYTDSFSVIDYYNGSKHTYNAYIGKKGFPTIALFSTEETDEANGLEIRVAVKPADCMKFCEEAREVYRWFKTRPTIVGQQIEFPDEKPVFGRNGWTAHKSSKNLVIMGNVAYPLDAYQAGVGNNHALSYFNIHIEVGIGEVEMTASRESLEYTAKTKAAIQQRITEMGECVAEEMQEQFDKQPTLWEATRFLNVNNLFIKNWTWQGIKVSSNGVIPLEKSYDCHIFSSSHRGGTVKMKKNETFSHIRCDDRYIYVNNDLPRGAMDRVRQMVHNTKNEKVYLVKLDATQKAEFMSKAGTLPQGVFIEASTLPKVVRVKTGVGGVPVIQCYRLNIGAEHKKDRWTQQEFDANAEGVYVELDTWEIKDSDWAKTRKLVAALAELGYDKPVYGLRKKVLKKAQVSPTWVTLDDYGMQALEAKASDYDFAVNREEYEGYDGLLHMAKFLTTMDLASLGQRIKYAKLHEDDLTALLKVMNHYNMNYISRTNVNSEVKELRTKYPLFFFILNQVESYKLGTLPNAAMEEYIKLMDQKGLDNWPTDVMI